MLLSLVGVVFCGSLCLERERTQEREAERLQAQARVVDENLIRQLEGVNKALAGAGASLHNVDSKRAAAMTSQRLKVLQEAMPGVRTMTMLDADGIIVASSRDELIGKSFGQRDYFAVPLKRPNSDVLYVSSPFLSSLGSFVIVVSRVMTDEHGDFSGVIAATLDPSYFDVVLRSVVYAPDMHAVLLHGDGTAFVSVPPRADASAIDPDGRDSWLRRRLHAGTSSVVKSVRTESGEDRMLAMRSVSRPDVPMDRPLVVEVSRELSEVYADWDTKVVRYVSFFALLLIASSAALFLSQRSRRIVDRLAADVARQRQQGAERLELALQGANLGMWDLHLPSDALVANERERTILGYADKEEILLDAGWRALIHPDDLAVVTAAVEPHLRGEVEAYECEHRVRHRDGHWVWVFTRAMVAERDAAGAPVRIVGTHLDITAAKQAEAARQDAELRRARSEERLSLALEGSGLALFDWDIAGDRIYHSAQAAVMRGDSPAETTASSREMQAFVHPDDLTPMLAQIRDALKGTSPLYNAEFRIRRRSGAWLWVRARGRVVERDDKGRAARLAGVYVNINDRKVSEARLRHLAEFDTLTDLPNRAQFLERLQKAMARATSESNMAVMFLDIDHFKTINDTLGHEAGDQLLKVFAQRMLASVRQSDMVARFAGDEFTIILEGVREVVDTRTVANKLIETLREPISLGGKLFEITASIGVAMCLAGETDDAALLRRADLALYEAKRRGRNGFFWEEGEVKGGVPLVNGPPNFLIH